MGISTPIEAYSVSAKGVVFWDEEGVNSSGVFVSPDNALNWNTANTACKTSGGRLPNMEELKSLSKASYILMNTHTPPGFKSTRYWTGTVVPSSSNSAHYSVDTSNGAVNGYPVTSNLTVRCVR